MCPMPMLVAVIFEAGDDVDVGMEDDLPGNGVVVYVNLVVTRVFESIENSGLPLFL